MGDRENLAAIRGIRELFRNRFTDEEVATLYDLNGRDLKATAHYMLTAEAYEVRETLEEQNGWQIVSSRRPIPQDIVERVRHGFVTTTTCQFSCGRCDVSWWRIVPERKQVSKCNRCKTKYDPVPRNKEWGWAEFHCTYCNNNFSGYCQMGQASPCYGCSRRVFPTRIKPQKPDRPRGTAARERRGHSCDACRAVPGISTTCVHPQTRQRLRLPKVVTASEHHESTGSTVDTFIPQNDLTRDRFVIFDEMPSMPPINEESEDNADNSD